MEGHNTAYKKNTSQCLCICLCKVSGEKLNKRKRDDKKYVDFLSCFEMNL